MSKTPRKCYFSIVLCKKFATSMPNFLIKRVVVIGYDRYKTYVQPGAFSRKKIGLKCQILTFGDI